MNARALAEALRLVAAAIEAAPDVAVVAPGHDELVDARGSGIGQKLFRKLVRSGALKGSLVGRRFMVRRSDLDGWLAAQTVQPRALSPRQTKPGGSAEADADEAFQRALSRGTLRMVKGGSR